MQYKSETFMIKIPETKEEFERALVVRFNVLLKPQGYSYADVKKYDLNNDPVTVVSIEGGRVVGSATAFITSSVESKLVYLAVLPEYQRKGIGKELVVALEVELKKRGVKRSVIQARTYLKEFYGRLGYLPTGDILKFPGFEENGILHQQMVKEL